MFLPIALFSVTGLIFLAFSFFIRKKSDLTNSDPNKVLIGLLRVFGVGIIIVGNAYAVLDHKGWSPDNAQNFKYIAVLTLCLAMVFVGFRFVRNNRLGVARTGAMIWILLWLGIGAYGVMVIRNSNQGWTEEKKQDILNKCPAVKYERLCYLEQVIKMFPNPEDYNKMTPKQEVKLDKAIEANCLLCDEAREAKQTETVDGLPDDF